MEIEIEVYEHFAPEDTEFDEYPYSISVIKNDLIIHEFHGGAYSGIRDQVETMIHHMELILDDFAELHVNRIQGFEVI